MAVTTSEWLSKRGGELAPGTVQNTWLVKLAGEPQYRLVPVPVKGRFGIQVTRTVDGQRLDSGSVYDGVDDALQGGLADLRKALGW